jgi:hypothetical protein
MITYVNGVCAVVSIYYVWVFFLHSPHIMKVSRFDPFSEMKPFQNNIRMSLLIFLASGLALFYHIYYRVEFDSGKTQLGLLVTVTTVTMFGSPLSTSVCDFPFSLHHIIQATVIRLKDASSIPLALSIASLACSAVWYAYGVLIEDFWIKFPNLLGVILSIFQLALIFQYGQRKVLPLPILKEEVNFVK